MTLTEQLIKRHGLNIVIHVTSLSRLDTVVVEHRACDLLVGVTAQHHVFGGRPIGSACVCVDPVLISDTLH